MSRVINGKNNSAGLQRTFGHGNTGGWQNCKLKRKMRQLRPKGKKSAPQKASWSQACNANLQCIKKRGNRTHIAKRITAAVDFFARLLRHCMKQLVVLISIDELKGTL